MNSSQSKNALRDNPEPETVILTLAMDAQPSNRTRESLLDERMALKATRDKAN